MRSAIFLITLLSLLFILPVISYAQAPPPRIGITDQPGNSGVQVIKNKTKAPIGKIVGDIVNKTVVLFFTIGAIGVLIMFLWGAVAWIISGGDKEALANARKRITTAIIGVVLLSLAFVIILIISQITGFNILQQLAIPRWGI